MHDSLREPLLSLNADLLKGWLKRMEVLLKGVTRKNEFVRLIEQQITLNLPDVLDRLSPAEHRLLADAAHLGRLLSPREFSARCGLKHPTVSHSAKNKQAVPVPKLVRTLVARLRQDRLTSNAKSESGTSAFASRVRLGLAAVAGRSSTINQSATR